MFTKLKISVIGICIALFLLTSTKSHGQTIRNSTTWKAMVLDSATYLPVANATVLLNSKSDSFIAKALTRTDGSFEFSLLKQVSYNISVSAIGYRKLIIPILVKDTLVTDFETIMLAKENKSLSTVTITADKKLIKQEIDRISYDLQADPDSKSSSVLEMMRKVPMLTVDGNDDIELKGSGNYRILINGKPSALMERNAKEVLRSMPASTIQKIEVITTPPSKYDAEGLSGIINIITNKTIAGGYKGTVNANFTMPTGGPGVGASISAKTGKFGITAFTGGGIYNTPTTRGYNHRVGYSNFLYQQSTNEKDSYSGYFGTEVSFEVDSLNLFSGSFNINGSRGKGNLVQSSNSTGQSSESYLQAGRSSDSGNGKDFSLNYQLGFAKNAKKFITSSYRYYDYGYDNGTFNGFSQRVNFEQPDYEQNDKGKSVEQTLQLDFVSKIKKVDVEAGFKGIFRHNMSNFDFSEFNDISGDLQSELQTKNSFNNTQNVYAAYNSFQLKFGALGIKAGYRIEYTRIYADLRTSDTKLSQQKFNLLPTLAIGYRLGEVSSLNFGFTQRIQRPGIYQLNPFVNRSNPNIEISGNPALRPVVGNSLQIGLSIQQKASININLDYTSFNSLINQVTVYNPTQDITRTTYQNTGTARLGGANLNINYPLTKKWNVSVNFKMYYGMVKGLSDNIPISTAGLMLSIGTNMSYKFDKGWRTNASINYRNKGFSLQRKTSAITTSSFVISKELINSKLTLSLSCNNPFTKYRSNLIYLNGHTFEQTTTDISYNRSYRISLNYNFGKLKDGIRKTKKTIKNDDISN